MVDSLTDFSSYSTMNMFCQRDSPDHDLIEVFGIIKESLNPLHLVGAGRLDEYEALVRWLETQSSVHAN
jgi:hypothetical protein